MDHVRTILSYELLEVSRGYHGESYLSIRREWDTMELISRHNNHLDVRSEMLCEGLESDLGSVDLIGVGIGEDEEFLFISHIRPSYGG
jgi:hypothetical protein